jgi:hypothetical protein
MKIFPPKETATKPEGPVKKTGKGKKTAVVSDQVKPEISSSAIREKLAGHAEISNTAKSKLIQKNSKALGSGFMNEDAKPIPKEVGVEAEPEAEISSLKKSHLLMSDVKLNDPTDSNTQEKLKAVLKMGAFNFNPKEKEALEKILG